VNFLADESVDQPIVTRLRKDGHDVVYIAEATPGISDSKVLDQAAKDRRVLLTGDKDFGELVYRQQRANHGVVLLRLDGMATADKATLVSSVVSQHGRKMFDSFSVVTATAIRIRRAKS
jgi:predicted nuclease of predicted toxin-antitoxin system